VGAQSTAELDFGAFPGASDASVTVTGQASILVSSLVEAWIYPKDTTDHTADEHMLESIKVFAHTIVAGTGFTITGINTSEINEPLEQIKGKQNTTTGVLQAAQGDQRQRAGGIGTRIYGKWTVGWVWN
jgi:hypothetical protein